MNYQFIKHLIFKKYFDNLGRSIKAALNYQEKYNKNYKYKCLLYCPGKWGFSGRGKITPDFFYPCFIREMNKRNIKVVFSKEKSIPKNFDITIWIINEDFDNLSKLISEYGGENNGLQINNINYLPMIADKLKTNEILRNNSILVPSTNIKETKKVFQNERWGSGRDTKIIFDQNKKENLYQTEYIDSTFYFEGIKYYLSIRALSCCGELVSIFPRIKEFDSQNASVHSADTPLEPKLINFVYEEYVSKNYKDIQKLCKEIDRVFPNCCLAHDLVLNDNKFYVCETGIKFDDYGFTAHMSSIYDEINITEFQNLFLPSFSKKFADVIFNKLIND